MAAGQGFTVNWNGRAISGASREACRKGINATLADCVAQSQQTGYVPVDTGALKNSLRFQAAEGSGPTLTGSFGSYTVPYAIWMEIGTRFVTGKLYLRRSADLHFRELPDHIRDFMS